MNAELQIAAAVAAIRRPAAPANNRLQAGSSRGGHRAPAQDQAGGPKRFAPQAGGGGPVSNPWPARPRISRTGRKPLEAAAAVAGKPAVVFASGAILLAGLLRIAAELWPSSGPVIVHMFYGA